MRIPICIALAALAVAACTSGELMQETVQISDRLTVVRGPVNGALLESNGKALVFYGDPRDEPMRADVVLFTHHRRDVAWAGQRLVEAGAEAYVPANEKELFDDVEAFWNGFTNNQFHDYYQITTKVLTKSIPVARAVRGGDVIDWEGVGIHVLDTPGYTTGAVSYLVETGGKKIAFTGDLIYGQGQLLDLYSLQDAVPELNVRGYHGYAGRCGQLVRSLRRIQSESPDVIVPARGPVITDVDAAINRLVENIQASYKSYLLTSAYRWYFGDDTMDGLAQRVSGPSTKMDWPPFADTIYEKPPEWIVPIGNNRLLISESGAAFLVDGCNQQTIDKVEALRDAGQFHTLEGVYISHYHDDHTDAVPAIAEAYGCKVYACAELQDILLNPSAYRMPCLTTNPLETLATMKEGEKIRWHEFELTFSYHPGQTLYHGALLVEKDGAEKILFVGDSFTPSGLDDYCLQNRNFLHPDSGFFYCLDVLDRMDPECLLINQHVVQTFRFSTGQIQVMRDELARRATILRAVFPWDDPNYGIDERWAGFYPYGRKIDPGESAEFQLRIMNHSNKKRTFQIRPRAPEGWRADPETFSITLGPRKNGGADFTIIPSPGVRPGVHLVTADIATDDWDLREWTEGMIQVGAE